MSHETLMHLMEWLVVAMQVSIVVPMAVVWRRRRHFSAPVKLLSWYVYLSAASVVGARLLYPAYFATNHGFIIGFNLGKVLLFGAVYYQVLARNATRQFVLGATLATVIGSASFVGYDTTLAIKISRVAQCTLLAGFALLYLEQLLTQLGPRPTALHAPLWLLSVGQLLYSAGTVTAFSLEYVYASAFDSISKFSFASVSGLVFNYFLTLAFLRATSTNEPVPETEAPSNNQLAGS